MEGDRGSNAGDNDNGGLAADGIGVKQERSGDNSDAEQGGGDQRLALDMGMSLSEPSSSPWQATFVKAKAPCISSLRSD